MPVQPVLALVLSALVLGVPRDFAQPSQAPADPPRPSCDVLFDQNRKRWPVDLPDTLERARRLHLRGKCALAEGRFAKARAYFAQGMRHDPSLALHWESQLFRVALARGDAEDGLAALRNLKANAPDTASRNIIRALLADQITRSRPREEDYRYLSSYFSDQEPVPADFPLLRHLSLLAEQRQNAALWRRVQMMLWKAPRNRSEAQEGARLLAALKKPRLTSTDALTRTRHLADARLFDLIVSELGAPGAPVWRGDAGRELGSYYFRGLFRLKKYRRAGEEVTNPAFVKRFSLRKEDVLRIAVQINFKRSRIDLAIKRLSQLRRLNPAEKNLPVFHLQVAQYYQERQNLRLTLQWCKKLTERYPTAFSAAEAYWLPIWTHYRRGEYHAALGWADSAITHTRTFSPETRSRYFYWRARILTALKRPEQARKAWQTLDERLPTSFYGLMARYLREKAPLRVPDISTARPGRKTLAPPQLKAVWRREDLRRGMFLFVVGSSERAAAIMGRVLGTPLTDGLLLELGEAFRYFGRFRLQYRITAHYYYADLKRFPVTNTPAWQHAYPRAFQHDVLRQAHNHGVSPFFVWAVMREESNFLPTAVSIAGATGLMQLMPTTARMVARRHRLPYHKQALTKPDFNITLGTLYLKNVLKRNEGNPIFAAAAYNAGPNAVKRWQYRFGKISIDEFVERIPYPETKAYVKRVLSSYLIYRQLYSLGRPFRSGARGERKTLLGSASRQR